MSKRLWKPNLFFSNTTKKKKLIKTNIKIKTKLIFHYYQCTTLIKSFIADSKRPSAWRTCKHLVVTWPPHPMQVGGVGSIRIHPVPDLREGPHDGPMIVGGVELQEAVEQLFEIILGVYLLLQNHLQHWLPEIQIRVVGILLHRHARPADPPEPLHGAEALDVGLGVVGGLAHRRRVDGRGECGGGGVPRAGGGVVVVAAVGSVPRLGVEDGGELRTPATAAASQVYADWTQREPFLSAWHCGERTELRRRSVCVCVWRSWELSLLVENLLWFLEWGSKVLSHINSACERLWDPLC